MGFAIDTNETMDFVLNSDQDKPKDRQPVLVFRYVSSRDWLRMSKLFAEAHDAKDVETLLGKTYEGIRVALVDWRNLSVPYNPLDLDLVTTPSDCMEIRNRLLDELTTNEQSCKKKSKSPSPSSTDKSASTVTMASADPAPVK